MTDKVLTMVRRTLTWHPDTDSTTLYERAKKLDRRIGRLSIRQFHAKYPLRVMRERALSTSSRGGRK